MSPAATALEEAARLVAAAKRGIAFTGAGVSAESGIRTYRGEGGLWKEYDPFKVASIEYFRNDPSIYWRVSRDRWATFRAAQPNAGHVALAAMEAAGHLVAVVTQNTDGLHAEAGTRRVLELHGSGRSVRCLDCGATESREDVQARLDRELPPRCQHCGGSHLKPEVVFFGEPLPGATIAEAIALARSCDLMLVVGSSLQVQPAASIPETALQTGAPLVIVNDEPTYLDSRAAAVLRGRSGELLPEILRLAGR